MTKNRIFTALLSLCAIQSAHANQNFDIENIQVFKGGNIADWWSANPTSAILTDKFDNNNPFLAPNFSNGSPATYSLVGLENAADLSKAISESDGRLHLAPDYASLSTNATGAGLSHALGLRLQTNTTSAGSGLNQAETFAVKALFPLVSPLAGNQYGIRLTDSFSNLSDVIDLRVANVGAGDYLFMRKQNFVAGTISDVSSTPLLAPSDAAYISLSLAHETAGSNQIKGYWGFNNASGDLIGSLNSFALSSTIFNGEDHTRFEIRGITAAVPEPTSYAMLLAGLGILTWRQRRSR